MQLTSRIRPSANDQNTSTSPENKDSKARRYIDRDPDDERNSKQYRKQKSNACSRLMGRLKYHWSLLSASSKVAAVLMVLYFCQHVLLGIWDWRFHSVGSIASRNKNVRLLNEESSFAVVINTYKRPDRLREAVQHYADTCGKRAGVGQVFIVWCEQGVPLPTPQSFFDDNTNLRYNNIQNRAQVQVLQKANSLNSRFEPIEAMKTTSVFMVDDDLRVACPSLYNAFEAWKAYPDSMVGFYPRLASPPLMDPESTTQLVYHTWPVVYYRHSFNFVLTKASFLHSKYLDLYTNQFPKSIKDHVDQHMNCEDIAMSMLVANYTKYKSSNGVPARPIFVEGSVTDRGIIGGISTGTGHMSTRSECLTKLTAILKDYHWGSPLDYKVPLGPNSWIHHAPGFWWQYQPSNYFEWLAFSNTFT